MRLLPGLIAIGASFDGIPQYGPTSGDRCLSPSDDDTGRYTMQYSHESHNVIEYECRKTSDCDIVVKFSKPELMGSIGKIDQTYFEMGSTQSYLPCLYKSPKVTAMEVVYTKKGTQLRANQVPTYGPVGINSCLGPHDRPYENYSMLKNYESLSLAKKYCNMYQNCDIIVEIDRTRVANRSLIKLYEIGNTKSAHSCTPRPQQGVKVSRVSFSLNQYANLQVPMYSPSEPTERRDRVNQGQEYFNNENENYSQNNYNQDYVSNGGHNDYGQGYQSRKPKRRETVDFKCLQIGEEESKTEMNSTGCAQIFDTIETANLACSLFETCLLIGRNNDGNFELFKESDDNTVTDLGDYSLSIPTMDKTQTSLFYDFTTILNHENMAITQITAYDPFMDTSIVEVPKHGVIPESTHLIFYDQNLSVVIQENTCVIRHPEQTEKLNGHMATTIDYKIQKDHGNLDVDDGEYSISDFSYIRDQLPTIAKKECYGKTLIGLDFDLKQFGHETDFGDKFFFMNETESFQEDNSLVRSKRDERKEAFDPVTKQVGKITNCNGKKACGDPNFTAAICSKDSCGTLFCMFLRRGKITAPGKPPQKAGGDGAVIEAPFVSWNHIIKTGYWCLPCCILEENIHPKMSVCSLIPTQEKICQQNDKHGRCGIEFNP